MVDWSSKESHLIVDPEAAPEVKLAQLPQFAAHIWLRSSGTTGSLRAIKFVALSKQNLLTSAAHVNQHLEASSGDVWINVLPNFHVGGLAIEARAFLTQSKVTSLFWKNWCPEEYCAQATQHRATLSALVPAHVFDLVKKNCRAPGCLRAVVVGGGHLREDLYRRARQLGWPLLPSYGMTEAASQIATAPLASLEKNQFPRLSLLPHVEAQTDTNEVLYIRGPSLHSGIAYVRGSQVQWVSHTREDWYKTADRVQLVRNQILFLNREDRIKKVLGELVDLEVLESQFYRYVNNFDFRFLALPDARQENQIVLVLLHNAWPQHRKRVNEFCKKLRKFEVPSALFFVEEFPKTPLGKIIDARLVERLLSIQIESLRE